MAKEEKRVLELDRYEHGVVINALNEMRNDLIGEDRPTDIVDELLLKTSDAPSRKRSGSNPERCPPSSGSRPRLKPSSIWAAGIRKTQNTIAQSSAITTRL